GGDRQRPGEDLDPDVADDHGDAQAEGEDLEPGDRRAPDDEGAGEERRRPLEPGRVVQRLGVESWTKISSGLIMPSSKRAFSSTISSPSLRSLTSAVSWAFRLRAASLTACCAASLARSSIMRGTPPLPNQSS